MMQPERPELHLTWEVPADPAEAEAARSKAATLVEEFVQDQALSALDHLLATAAEGGRVADEVVQETTVSSQVVDDEVTRFLSLARKRD